MQVQQGHATSHPREDLSFTILWSPLPPITWLIPFIGHTGIGDSRGIASDFQGPYYVGDNGRMAFGPPTRAVKMDIGTLPGGVSFYYFGIFAFSCPLLRIFMLAFFFLDFSLLGGTKPSRKPTIFTGEGTH
jgi:Protein of unknown function (DUF778)